LGEVLVDGSICNQGLGEVLVDGSICNQGLGEVLVDGSICNKGLGEVLVVFAGRFQHCDIVSVLHTRNILHKKKEMRSLQTLIN
jgi:hypothetical protein